MPYNPSTSREARCIQFRVFSSEFLVCADGALLTTVNFQLPTKHHIPCDVLVWASSVSLAATQEIPIGFYSSWY